MAISGSTVTIDTCVFTNNQGGGGGIYIVGSVVTIMNSAFSYNDSCAIRDDGDSNIMISDTTFGINNTNNVSTPCDIRINVGQIVSQVVIVNSVVRHPFVSDVVAYHSNIPDNTGEGNIDADPMWVDPENGDYRLRIGSPCIDSGTDTGLLVDLNGDPRPVDVRGIGYEGPRGYDMGAYEFQLSPADLDSNGDVDWEDLILFQEQWQESEDDGG